MEKQSEGLIRGKQLEENEAQMKMNLVQELHLRQNPSETFFYLKC